MLLLGALLQAVSQDDSPFEFDVGVNQFLSAFGELLVCMGAAAFILVLSVMLFSCTTTTTTTTTATTIRLLLRLLRLLLLRLLYY